VGNPVVFVDPSGHIAAPAIVPQPLPLVPNQEISINGYRKIGALNELLVNRDIEAFHFCITDPIGYYKRFLKKL